MALAIKIQDMGDCDENCDYAEVAGEGVLLTGGSRRIVLVDRGGQAVSTMQLDLVASKNSTAV